MAGQEGSSAGGPQGRILDARFHRCPLPVLHTRKALAELPKGAVLTVLVTDPAARIDMAHFCATEGHALLSVEETEGVLRFVVKKR